MRFRDGAVVLASRRSYRVRMISENIASRSFGLFTKLVTAVSAVSFLLLLLASACTHSSPAQAAPPPTPTVQTVPVVSKTLSTTDRLPAQLLPYEKVDIYPKVTGFIEEIRVDVGSHVKKGERLMRLSAPELVAQRAQAEASLQAAEAQLTTAKARLASDQGTFTNLESASKTPGVVAANDVMVARQTVQADQGAATAAEHNITAARDALRAVAQLESYLIIDAPFTGYVTVRNLHPGALVGPASGSSGTAPIVQIVDTDRLRLVVPVPEAEAATMKIGEPVTFAVPAYPGQAFHGPIARVSHDVNLQTRTMHAELDVDNRDGKLSPGSFATVTWPVERSYPTLFVPVSAVATDQERSFVIRVANGITEWVTVQTGNADRGTIEVVGELHEGDQVVRDATDSIRNGQKVESTTAK